VPIEEEEEEEEYIVLKNTHKKHVYEIQSP
jgi:hypothetical protein